MRRIGLVVLALSLALAPLHADAQPRKTPRIGFLSWGACPGPESVFGVALRDLGYTWGLANALVDLARSLAGREAVAPHAVGTSQQVCRRSGCGRGGRGGRRLVVDWPLDVGATTAGQPDVVD